MVMMNNKIVGLIFLSSLSLLTAQETNQSEVAIQHFMEGEFLLDQGNYAMAVLEFQEALEADPNGATIHISIADAFRRLGKLKRAEKHLKIAIELDPTDSEGFEMLGLLYMLEKRFDLAKLQFLELMKLDPENSDYPYSLGDIYRLSNQWNDAIDYYLLSYQLNTISTNALEQALQIALNIRQLIKAEEICELLIKEHPNDVKIHETYRDISIFNHHPEKALTAIDGLMNILGRSVDLLLQKSSIYQQNTDYHSALTLLDQAFVIDSMSQNIYQQYVSLFIDMEDYDQAIKYNNKLISLFPNDPKGFLNSAIVSLTNKEPKKATEILINNIDLLDGNFTAYYILGSAYNQLKEYDNAEQFLLKALRIHPTSRNTKHTLAMIWDSIHKWEKSDSLYLELIRTDSTDAQAMNNYAYSLSEREEMLPMALEHSMKAVQLSPNSAPYLDTLGWIYYKMGKHGEAIIYIEKSIELDSTNSLVIEHLGDILMDAHETAKAINAYKQALKLDSDNQTLKTKILSK